MLLMVRLVRGHETLGHTHQTPCRGGKRRGNVEDRSGPWVVTGIMGASFPQQQWWRTANGKCLTCLENRPNAYNEEEEEDDDDGPGFLRNGGTVANHHHRGNAPNSIELDFLGVVVVVVTRFVGTESFSIRIFISSRLGVNIYMVLR